MSKQIFNSVKLIDIAGLTTVLDFIRWGATQFEKNHLFYGHGAESAWDEASLLLLSCLKMSPNQYSEVLNCHLTEDEKKELVEKINIRIKTKKPVAYITNEAWFGGLSFYVDERVLVPRSPIAELIVNQFSPWLDSTEVKTAVDVCTGSACIACLLAHYFPQAQVDAIDISEEALAVAGMNIHNHGLEKQVNLIQSDLMKQVMNKKYDLIVTNPPYVAKNIVNTLAAEYQHEPELGLIAGDAGLDCIIPLLKQAKKTLNPGGFLVMEVGSSQEALENYFPHIQFLWLDFDNNATGVFILEQNELLKIKD